MPIRRYRIYEFRKEETKLPTFNQLVRKGREVLATKSTAPALQVSYNSKKKEYNDLFCNPYNAARYGYIDDIIELRNTRFRVIRALEQLAGKKQENPWKKHDNLPL